MNWHYSKSMPGGKLVKIGVWESGKFIGVVLFGYEATPNIGKPFNVKQTEICELVRIALRSHLTPVSQMVAIAVKMLKQTNPGLRLIVSYADKGQGHNGGIYQAGNWFFVGGKEYDWLYIKGKKVHPRTCGSKYGKGGQSIPWLRSHVDKNAKRIRTLAKYKYLMPLDKEMRNQIEPLRKPYPKRATSDTSDTVANHAAKGGATPTVALMSN